MNLYIVVHIGPLGGLKIIIFIDWHSKKKSYTFLKKNIYEFQL